MTFETQLTRQLHIDLPIIGGAMYPCSNPELVAAVSEAGGIGSQHFDSRDLECIPQSACGQCSRCK